MVIRKALIIGSPDADIPSVKIDIKNMNNFLLSPYGGAWKESEITNLTNPSKSVIRENIELLKTNDYSFVYFAGHGCYVKQRESTFININPNEILDSLELRQGAPKHTLILDCCRVLVEEKLLIESSLENLALDSATTRSKPTLSECRKYFNKKIIESNAGIVVMNGCSITEEANENPEIGGFYTSSLIKSALKMCNDKLLTINLDTHYRSFSTKECHSSASKTVKLLSGNRQNPILSSGRTNNSFPFSIVA